jgi:1,4-alpha-glucan branching enzyme
VEAVMSLQKKYTKDRKTCKVTFFVPKEAAQSAQKVTVAGDFNNWDNTATPLKRDKNGNFKVTLELEAGREYQFKYVIDGVTWENDWQADKYVTAGIGNAENSVVAV